MSRRAFFAYERGLRGPAPVVFYDTIPPRDGRPAALVASWELPDGTGNRTFFPNADETPSFSALIEAYPA